MAEAGWEGIAWHLWRYRWHTFPEISRFLLNEDWLVTPAEIEAACMARAAEQLQRRFEAGTPHPPSGPAAEGR